MPQSAADVVAVEIEALDKKLPMLFERDDMFFAFIAKAPSTVVSNRDFRIPLKLKPGGVTRGYDPDGGSLGAGSAPVLKHATLPKVDLSHTISWNEAVELGNNSPKKAVQQIVKNNLAEGMQEFRRNLDSLCVGGSNGKLGQVDGALATRTLTMDDDGFGTRLMREGMEIQAYATALGSVITNGKHTIDTIDHETRKITLSGTGTIGIGNNHSIVLAGLSGTPPKSILGVQHHHDNASTGTWLSLNRATYPNIRCNRVNGGNTSLTLAAARLAVNKIAIRAGMKEGMGMKVYAWMHQAQQAAYEALGQGIQRIMMDGKGDKNLDMYFNGGMSMAGAKVMTHASWDKKRIDFISDKNWARAENDPIGFFGKQHGRKVFEGRASDGSVNASWHSFITHSFNIYMHNPLAESYIDNLTFASGY